MRLNSRALILLVALAACWDGKHPRELVGTWARDSVYGGILRGTDTLRLRKDGLALRSGGITPIDPASTGIKPQVYSEGLKWDFRPRVEGQLLCFLVDKGWEPECHTLRIASESLLVVDDRGYRRLADR